MVKKNILFSIGMFFVFFFGISLVSAWDFYGYAYDVNGNPLYNASINITFWTMGGGPPTLVGSNASTSNAIGWFNFSVYENSSWMYKPIIRHFAENRTDGSTPIDYIGQTLPQFPFQEFNGATDINFYLIEAGTINITAVNATGSAKTFQYIVKDTKLGYPIAEGFGSYISQATVYVPRNRNYTIQIYPNQSVPVSYHWNNFSATSSYNISTPSNNINLSRYNATNHTLHKQFNCTESFVWVNGYIANSTGQNLVWNEFKIVPFVLEAGNMIYLGDNAAMPYNMSAWRRNATGAQLWTDNYSLSTGFYNITLPGPAESMQYILFVTARNGTDYYGGYRNLSLNYTDGGTQVNFTMYKLMSTDWNSLVSNITMNNAMDWNQINISSAKKAFNLVNATTNATFSQMNAHIEITVDYSDYNATEFTFMTDLSNENGTFYLPLINATGVKEINIYSNNYAPKRVGARTTAQILSNNNITMNFFNPGAIEEGQVSESEVFIKLYKSNSTCDTPNPANSCQIGAFGPDENQPREDFSPLSSIIGGGKLNFRMGYSGIEIIYINVDMLASGPPDMEFENDAGDSEKSTSFENAIKFGSMGPTIYDYVLISMPYTEGNSSQTGLNEEEQVNVSIPLFYDEDWNVIWNSTLNGTSGGALAGNHSHYSTYSSEWQTLMGNNTCRTNKSEINETNPCYIDSDNDRIWIRLPHFSGAGPSITGYLLTATASPSTDSSGGSGGTSSVNEWAEQKVQSWTKITPGNVSIMKNFDKDIGIKEIWIEVDNPAQNVKIIVRKYDNKPANVSVNKTGKVYQYLQIETQNLESKLDKAIVTIKVEKNWTDNNNITKENVALFKFDDVEDEWNNLTTIYLAEENETYYYAVELNSFSYFAISEKVAISAEAVVGETGEEEQSLIGEEETNLTWLWVLIAVVVLAIIIGGAKVLKKKR